MLTAIDIEAASVGDAEAIGRISVAAWRAVYDGIVPASHLDSLSIKDKIAFWHSVLSNADSMKAGTILVAKHSDVPNSSQSQAVLGFLSFGSATEESSSSQGEIRAIYVDPQYWSEGVGRRLWEAALQKMVEAKHTTVIVDVFADNERALRFYRRLGFKDNQAGVTEVGGTTIATLQLKKTLD